MSTAQQQLALGTLPIVPNIADDKLANVNLSLRYNIKWEFLPMGRLRIGAQETDTSYKMNFDIKTKPVSGMFGKTVGDTVTSGLKTPDGHYIAQRYYSWNKRKSKRSVKMTYDQHGTLLARVRDPKDDPKWRAEVPLEKLNNSFDPVTALLVLRQRLFAHHQTGEPVTKIRAYDGRRLAEFTLTRTMPETPNSPKTLNIHGQNIPVIEMLITRQPLEGYTAKEQKKFAKGDPVVYGYFTDNKLLFPIAVKVELAFGALTLMIDADSLPQLLGAAHEDAT